MLAPVTPMVYIQLHTINPDLSFPHVSTCEPIVREPRCVFFSVPPPNASIPQDNPSPNPSRPRVPHTFHISILAETGSHVGPASFAEFLGIFTPDLSGFDIGGALVVGTAQHADDAQEDGLGCLDRRPALGGGLVAVWIVGRRVQNGDADRAVGVHYLIFLRH